jgi:hypothetical protein
MRNIALASLNLPPRQLKKLHAAGIKTLRQYIQLTTRNESRKVLGSHSFATFVRVQKGLYKLGYELHTEWVPRKIAKKKAG